MSDEKITKKINDAFTVLDELAEVGRKTRVVKVSDKFKLMLETLPANDEGEAFVSVEKYEGSEYFFKHKVEILSHSIFEINEKSLREYEKIEDEAEREKAKEDTINKIRTKIENWNDNVISFLYGEFLLLTEESERGLIKIGILKELPKKKEENEKEKEKTK